MSSGKESWDFGPPRDLRTEELYLSALLVSRGRDTYHARRADFHDPFHAWLFSCVTRKLTYRKMARACPQRWRPQLAAWIAGLLLTAEGKSRCGLVEDLPEYANRLKLLREKRARWERGQNMMIEAMK